MKKKLRLKRYVIPCLYVVLFATAEMIVAIAGEILRMPGLPKEPQALHIDIVDGEIEGLS